MSGIEAAFFGALGRDAERRTSAKSGKEFLRLNVRVGDGDAAQWVNVTSFDSDAINVADKFVKGARVYVEGSLKLDKWTGQDGAERHGLSCLSFHTRLTAIGRNKPKREPNGREAPAGDPRPSDNFHSDEIPF
jgi:single-strand DNA-binding protein